MPINYVKRLIMPVRLSQALTIINNLKRRHDYSPHWYTRPMEILIEQVGDIHVHDVTEAMVVEWWTNVQTMVSQRTGKPLSPYTTNSYLRALKSVFGKMTDMAHCKANPTARLRQSRLPVTPKNAISEADADKMLRYAARDLRDGAMLRVLADSGCRLGELASMVVGTTTISQYYRVTDVFGRPSIVTVKNGDEVPDDAVVRLRGSALVHSSKMLEYRGIHFGHTACEMLQRYLDTRLPDDPPNVWLSKREGDGAINKAGVSQVLKRVAKAAGVVGAYNAHAWRHRLVKNLKRDRVDPATVSAILGHRDASTYQMIYGRTTPDELADVHTLSVHSG